MHNNNINLRLLIQHISNIDDIFPYKLHEQRADRQACFTLLRGLCYSDGYSGRKTVQT